MSLSEHIRSLALDEGSIIRRSAEVEHERNAALHALLDKSLFTPLCLAEPAGPYDVTLGVRDNRLRFTIDADTLTQQREVVLPLAPFRRIIKDYFMIVESYMNARMQGEAHRLEALDMGRRGVHNEGSEMLLDVLAERIKVDFDTARRLFTLICVLHIKQ